MCVYSLVYRIIKVQVLLLVHWKQEVSLCNACMQGSSQKFLGELDCFVRVEMITVI